ncbi:MAG: ABC transporter permease [Mycobacteriales bacterium]|nr:MAG: ABC transporter permease [Pseudonocardiales bacterium]
MSFGSYLAGNWQDLLKLTVQHLLLVLVSVAIATVIGVALGVLTYQTAAPRAFVLAVTGIFLTIPSFALFGLLIAPLGLGYTPAVFALVMYALLPIVRNTITGLREVDSAVTESARAIGMGRWRRLAQVEVPLAWPVIITGIRVATLLDVGIAAIAAYVGGPGLGHDIFDGLDRIGFPVAFNLALSGTLGVIVIAIVLDIFFMFLGRFTTPRGIRG